MSVNGGFDTQLIKKALHATRDEQWLLGMFEIGTPSARSRWRPGAISEMICASCKVREGGAMVLLVFYFFFS